jgi:mannitol-1-phosphate 5-dehydrogenase
MVHRTIVIWGAGRIGRGFVADLFDEAGYGVVLVDQADKLVEALNAAGCYTVVRAESARIREERVISGYRALVTSQADEVGDAIVGAEILAVAVFPKDFPAVAQGMAPGLERRRAARPDLPLDILMATNLPAAAHRFRTLLLEALSPDGRAYAEDRVGVVDTLVIRMVPDAPAEERLREPLLVWTNGMAELPVDRHAFRGGVPAVPGLRLVDDMRAEETRKLYTYNMCHAALAYLGALRDHALTVDCLADPAVRAEAVGALDEVARALHAEYGFAPDEMARWNSGVLRQTDNPTLGDTVARHGADPGRKLKRADRLVGPALLARKHGIAPLHLVRAIAAAFLYRAAGDPGAAFVQERVAALGLPAAVREVCELTADEDDLADMIVSAFRELNRAAPPAGSQKPPLPASPRPRPGVGNRGSF